MERPLIWANLVEPVPTRCPPGDAAGRPQADFVTHPMEWEKTTMTDTISILHTKTGKSYELIKRWLSALDARSEAA